MTQTQERQERPELEEGHEQERHEQERLARVSPSRLSDFKQCPQLFKYRAIDRLEEPATVHQARGTTAHLALEYLFDLPTGQRTPSALYDLFRRAWMEVRDDDYSHLFDNAEEERRWGMESLELLANYFVLEDPTAIAPLDRELDMMDEVDGVLVRGILDRIDELPNGDLIITDYKTGKAPPERFALPAFFAMKIYALLIQKRLGRTPVELRLLYLNGPTMYRLAVTEYMLDRMGRQIAALWEAITRAIDRNDFRPRPQKLCNYCSFRDICPAFAAEPLTAVAAAD